MHLWRFLRPEFVKKYPKPLSSDSFSAFYHPAHKKERIADNREVQEATRFLYDALIPDFAHQVRRSFTHITLSLCVNTLR